MAGQSKTGGSYSVSFSLPKSLNPETDGYILVNAACVREFDMHFGMNAMPSGHVTCLVTGLKEIPVSGAYGMMLIQGQDDNKASDISFGVYISNLMHGQDTTGSSKITFDFTVGSKESELKQANFACTGTSAAAMKECVKAAGMESLCRYTGNGKNADSMVWRLVNGNFAENMNYIVSNSYVPSDLLFWTLDERKGKILISTFGTEKSSKVRSMMIYSQDALVSTANAEYMPNAMAGTSLYRYQTMSRMDHTSQWRAAMLPNLTVDTTSSSGVKETGDCGGECIEIIMNTAGASELPAALKPPKTGRGVYGEPKLAMAFPMNGHKKYAVAETIRARLMSEYSRVAKVRIFNHLGPVVGSCVYLVARNLMFAQGQIAPDADYTARYIVIEKHVTKQTSTSSGTLGNKRSTMTAEYVTELTLATNFQYTKNAAKEYGVVIDLMNQVANTLKKG